MGTDAQLRKRALIVAAGIVALGAGLASRYLLPPGFWSKYLGVALWSCLVYTAVLFVRPTLSVSRAAVVTLAISWGIEFLQLTPLPAWLSSQHLVLRLIFGTTFNAPDLLAYLLGVSAAFGVDACCRRGGADCR